MSPLYSTRPGVGDLGTRKVSQQREINKEKERMEKKDKVRERNSLD